MHGTNTWMHIIIILITAIKSDSLWPELSAKGQTPSHSFYIYRTDSFCCCFGSNLFCFFCQIHECPIFTFCSLFNAYVYVELYDQYVIYTYTCNNVMWSMMHHRRMIANIYIWVYDIYVVYIDPWHLSFIKYRDR